MIRAALALAAWGALTAPSEDRTAITRVDPLSVQDDDFARHRDAGEWRGLRVDRIDFRVERATWRLWRIADTAHPHGPLWFVPHDNENAGFEAALRDGQHSLARDLLTARLARKPGSARVMQDLGRCDTARAQVRGV